MLRVVGANDAVFLEKDDFAPSDCTGADPSVTSHRIESLESNVAYEVSVQSKTENLEDSDKASVNITLALELSTCNLPPDTTVCKCSPGEHHVEGDCEQCPQDSYSPDGLECVACPQGATSAAGSTQFSDCNCPANSINMNGVCVCEKGYGGDATLPHKVGPLLTTKISHALGLALALFVFFTNQPAPFLTPPLFSYDSSGMQGLPNRWIQGSRLERAVHRLPTRSEHSFPHFSGKEPIRVHLL